MAFEEARGGALLRGAAEAAHGVVVVRVAEAGGVQLAAHHRAGALVPRQVALQAALAVHTRAWGTTEEDTGSFPVSLSVFLDRKSVV